MDENTPLRIDYTCCGETYHFTNDVSLLAKFPVINSADRFIGKIRLVSHTGHYILFEIDDCAYSFPAAHTLIIAGKKRTV